MSDLPNGLLKWCGSLHAGPPASLESRRRSCSTRQALRACPLPLVPAIQSPAYDTDRTVGAPGLLLPGDEDSNKLDRSYHPPPEWSSTSYSRKSRGCPASNAPWRYPPDSKRLPF